MNFLLVAVGSAFGGALRYLVSLGLVAQKGFPWATLSVNVGGSFLIGLLSGLIARHCGGNGESVRLFAVVGFCGGFTTFSTLSNETFRLLEGSQWLSAAVYVGISVLAGLLAVCFGYWIVK